MRFQVLLSVLILALLTLPACQTGPSSEYPRSRVNRKRYYGYTGRPQLAVAPHKWAKGHSYYYASRDARSPYRDYLQVVDHNRTYGHPHHGFGVNGGVGPSPFLFAPRSFNYSTSCRGLHHFGSGRHDANTPCHH